MSLMADKYIAYLQIPNFGAVIARRVDSKLDGRALVLLDDDGVVLAADARASAAGVAFGQTERQALARCPVALLRPAVRYPIFETQAALWERAARYAGRWQPASLGAIYLDITGLGGNLIEWCQDLTTDIRAMGLIPSIGMTNSKFGASAAGQAAAPAHALFLTPVVQRAFLSHQTAALLPLEADALLQLRHLGVRTLGQFAQLPSAGVLSRWGRAGHTAHLWAQGHDDRPVVLPAERPQVTARIEYDGPVVDREILLTTLMRKAESLLNPLRDRLQATGWFALTVTRGDGRVLHLRHNFPLPTVAANTVRLALGSVLNRAAWDGEGAADMTLTFGDITDAPVQQLTLFDTPSPRQALSATLKKLSARYGLNTFCMAVLTEPDHPLAERRVSWQHFE